MRSPSGLVFLLPLLLLSGCGAPPGKQAAVSPPTQPAAPTQPAEPRAGEVRVTIDNFAFSPRTLTVAAGTKVVWVNRDDVPHTANDTENRFKSGTLDTDGDGVPDSYALQISVMGVPTTSQGSFLRITPEGTTKCPDPTGTC